MNNSVLSQLPNSSIADAFAPAGTVASAPVQPTQQSQASQQNSGSWLTRLLPTGGSILGGIAGTFLDPFTAGMGTIGGAAAGGAAGKALENAIEGNKDLGAGVGVSALEGGIGQGVGGALAKGAGALLGGVVKPVASKLGIDLLAGQGGGNLAKTDAEYLFNNGVTNLSHHANDIAPIVTGAEGALSNGVRNSLSNASEQGIRMNFSGLPDLANEATINAGIGGNPGAVNSVNKVIQSELQRAVGKDGFIKVPARGKGPDVINFNSGVLQRIDPNEALTTSNNLYNIADKWTQSGDPIMRAQGMALKSVSNQIKDQLYGPDTAIGKIGITPQVKEQILADLEPLKQVNPQYYATKVSELNNAKTLGDLRSSQAVDVRASIAHDAKSQAENMGGGVQLPDVVKLGGPALGYSVGGPAGLVAGLTANKVLGSEAAQTGATGILAKLSDVIGNKQAGKVADTLVRAGATGAATIPSMGAQPIDNTAPQVGAPLTGQLTSAQGGANMNPQTQNAPGLQDYVNAMQAESVLAPQFFPGATNFMSSAFPQLQKNTLATSALSQINPAFAQAGGAQGPLGGILSKLQGLIPGTAPNVYQGDVTAAAAQLAQALGISPQEAINLLPQLTQGQVSAGQRQGVLSSLGGALVQ